MSATHEAGARGARRAAAQLWAARLAWLIGAALAALLVLDWAKLAYNAYLTAIWPGQMDYGEGIIWQQAALIPGPRMYGDVQQYPFLVFHYPPLYHLVVHAVAMAGVPWLMAGRLVSTASALAVAALAGALVFEATRRTVPRSAAVAAAILAALLFSTFQPIQFWARTMRVDLLALALEFLGLYLGLLALRQPRLLYAAALVFVLAAYTKQTALGGAVATFAVAFVRMPGRAIRAGLLAVVVGGAIFAGMMAATDGGFVRHIILYNVNRFSLAAAWTTLRLIGAVATYPAYIVTAAAVTALILVQLGRRRRRLGEVSPGPVIFALYFLLATANLVALGKSGAWSNYLLPWVSSWALLIGVAAAEACKGLLARPARPVSALLLLAILVPQVLVSPVARGERQLTDPTFRREHDALVSMIEHAGKPVFSDDMTLLMEAGREVPWEPSIISELSAKGLFDERKVVALINSRAFAFMVIWGRPGDPWYDARYSPAVSAAIQRNYPIAQALADEHLYRPAPGGLPP